VKAAGNRYWACAFALFCACADTYRESDSSARPMPSVAPPAALGGAPGSVSARDSGSDDPCAQASVPTDGTCDIELPDEAWVDRFDCTALVRLSGTVLVCDSPDGFHVLETRRLRLEGEACDSARRHADAPLEILIPCSLVP